MIQSVKDDILNFAPGNSEAIAIWAYSGFAERPEIFRSRLQELNLRIELVQPVDLISEQLDKREPWLLELDTLWRLMGDSQGRFKYVYCFSNSDNRNRLDSLVEIDELITRCLNALQEVSVESVSFILIPAKAHGQDSELRESDLLSAKQMIKSIDSWIGLNNSDLKVFLVDRAGDFEGIIKEVIG